ncbi:External alternative NAD(P)H-ubiquinone oxidoreductase B3 mitochondrial [Zea mays]|uniref:External alternative NAD(P)H-ubiquinone oxidoreductase B3 mitochondrial n=1 Tax=Zea mays TaxID=4577 RepID=A0A1D6EFG5_MAIZE|nr:External alternative NAD(P)H-ubiquinone oxidoreductase B3 mitochondrial [Zea mays]
MARRVRCLRYRHLGQFAPLGGKQTAAQLPGDWISIGHSTQWLWYSVYATRLVRWGGGIKEQNQTLELVIMAWELIEVPGNLNPSLKDSSVDVVAAKIDPKLANTLIRQLSQVCPLENLRHVKRVRRRTECGGICTFILFFFFCPLRALLLEDMPSLPKSTR